MQKNLLFMLSALIACGSSPQHSGVISHLLPAPVYNYTVDIPVPAGYKRAEADKNSFAAYLRSIEIRKDNQVYLYNGKLKRNQSAQFAVLAIPVGNKDLQQCADAVIRLRAEYLFGQGRYTEIVFRDNKNTEYRLPPGAHRPAFDRYLERVFASCGTSSLAKQLHPVSDTKLIQPGDVFIRGGGHAMIVMDVAINEHGRKVFMLAQSYMPAQDIHIVNNLLPDNNPWYQVNDDEEIITPEWIFKKSELKRW